MKFSIMQLGCKVNDFEATYIKNELLKYYKYVDFKEKSDIIIIFSCCVTNQAETKTRKFIHQAKRNNPDSYLVVIGCLAQIKPNLEEFSDVDLLIGSTNKDKAVELILKNTKRNCVEKLDNCTFEKLYLENYPGKDRAFLKIQDGCNQFCSYCIIPYARGKERSCNHEDVLTQAKNLSKSFNEIVLTGIHTGRYNDNGYKLFDLLKDLIKIENLKTIRLSSIEITEITDEIIKLIKSNDKIAHHLHIPVQSLNNDILRLMHRPYTIEAFIERINYIRNEIPDISISTDLIVGFPNENDEIFNDIKNKLNTISFSFVHCFPYSRKSGTLADRIEGHIDNGIKKRRVNEVLNIQKTITQNFYKKFINKNVEVLIEKNDNIFSYGYSKEYIYIKVNKVLKEGNIYKINIIDVNENEVIGNVVE